MFVILKTKCRVTFCFHCSASYYSTSAHTCDSQWVAAGTISEHYQGENHQTLSILLITDVLPLISVGFWYELDTPKVVEPGASDVNRKQSRRAPEKKYFDSDSSTDHGIMQCDPVLSVSNRVAC